MVKSIVKQLEEKYGGKWKYIPFASMWVCDELNLMACYVAEGGYDMDGNYIPVPEIFKRLTVYGIKPHPEKFYPETNKKHLLKTKIDK